jgi:site-specific DNA recombinase
MEDFKKEIKLIAVYARVSTARQEEEHTIGTQLSAVREFAEKKGYTIVKEYIDDGWSGDMLARPQLDQLRQDVKNKIWEGILAYDPDRLARRYSYQELVMDELKEAGVEVLFVTTPSPKNGEEKILQGVKGLFAEYERVKIAERFRLGKMRKVKEGHILTSQAPYGLIYVPKRDGEHGHYEINEDEIRVLKMIFSLIADEKMTLRAVVKRLQALDLGPRKSKRGVWSTSTLSHLLCNRTYIGEAYYGKSYAVVPENPHNTEKYRKIKKTSSRLRPKDEWITIPVPAILDKELFDQAQKRLRVNSEFSRRNRKNEYLLNGKIWCICNSRRTGEGPNQGKHLYYRCINKIHTFPFPQMCHEKGINSKIADQLVWQRVSTLMSSPELISKQLNRWLNERRENGNGSLENTENLRNEIARLKEKENRYTKAYGAGIYPIEKLKEYVIPIRERVAALEGQIAEAETGENRINGATLPTNDQIEVFARRSAETFHRLKFEAKQAIVRNVLDRVVGTPRELQISGYIPVTEKDYVKLCSIDRHRWNATRHVEDRGIPFAFTITLPPPQPRFGIVASHKKAA